MGTEADLSAEVTRARTKFPGSRFLLAALVEEVGELAEAVVSGDKEAIYKEAIQCACVAVRIAEEGDPVAYHEWSFVSLTIATGRIAQGLLQKSKIGELVEGARRAIARIQESGDPTFADITDEEAKP